MRSKKFEISQFKQAEEKVVDDKQVDNQPEMRFDTNELDRQLSTDASKQVDTIPRSKPCHAYLSVIGGFIYMLVSTHFFALTLHLPFLETWFRVHVKQYSSVSGLLLRCRHQTSLDHSSIALRGQYVRGTCWSLGCLKVPSESVSDFFCFIKVKLTNVFLLTDCYS